MHRARVTRGVSERFIAAAVALAALPGCARVEPARLRVAHGAADGAALDVCVDREVTFAGVAFGDVSAYVDVGAEAHRLRIIATGAGCESGAAVGVDFVPAAQTDSTLLLVGSAAGTTAITLVDDNRTPGARDSRLRVVNALLDGTEVDVSLDSGAAMFAEVPALTASGYLDVESDNYTFAVRESVGQTVLASLADAELEVGNVYTLFVFGPAAEEPAVRAVLAVDRR
ncbi:MAG: hypothetical protein CHACPFDD_00715 [Phycisphaerae bacterium]|nr:hypothetical protein [Phycisphaerae bacterium]